MTRRETGALPAPWMGSQVPVVTARQSIEQRLERRRDPSALRQAIPTIDAIRVDARVTSPRSLVPAPPSSCARVGAP